MATNRNARIITRTDRNGNVRTETTGRDIGEFDVAVTTDKKKSTRVYLDLYGRNAARAGGLELDGRQARTLYLALQKHFASS